MTVMRSELEVSSPPSAKSTARLGARAVLAAVALALVAVPGALTLLLVENKWAPLLRVDDGARDRLHDYACDPHRVLSDESTRAVDQAAAREDGG